MNPLCELFQTLPIVESGYIAGVIVFNRHGIPIDSYSMDAEDDGRWIQAALQSLGVQTLLQQYLQIENFEQLTLQAADYKVLLRKQEQGYEGLLIQQFSLDKLAARFAQYRAAS